MQNSLNQYGYNQGMLPVTEYVTQQILSLPMYAGITTAQIDRVITLIHEYANEVLLVW